MPAFTEPIVVTGSAGFIGGHFCQAVSAAIPGVPLLGIDRAPCPHACGSFAMLDLACEGTLERIAAEWRGGIVVHLAADAEVLIPWHRIPRMFASNLTATWNVLHVLRPRLCIFASSSSVYGNASFAGTDPRMGAVAPRGLYAHSKAMAETLLRDWCSETGASALVFRLGNIVGPCCHGLIPYLVEHARRYPDAERPAELRGDGRLVRDYTPVRFVADVMLAALNGASPPSGTVEIFNVGTGRGLTNRDVARIVACALDREGYRLRANYGNPVSEAEARSVVLDCSGLRERFGLALPGESEVSGAIQSAALSHLARRSMHV